MICVISRSFEALAITVEEKGQSAYTMLKKIRTAAKYEYDRRKTADKDKEE